MQQSNSKIYFFYVGVLLIAFAGFKYWLYSESKIENRFLLLDSKNLVDNKEANNKQTLLDLDYKEDRLEKNFNPKEYKVFEDSKREKIEDIQAKPKLDDKSYKQASKNPSEKPKLAIIIDDLAIPKDIKAFKELNLKLNLSLFPKHVFSQSNPKMAKMLEFYMIHLPLEANNFKQNGVRVINTGDSIEEIKSYIYEIKQDFPNLRYINNHTGSRYTASKKDMQKLLNVLDEYGITFVDSKTSTSNVIKEIYDMKNKIYMQRDIFLDNESNTKYISAQLEKALTIASKKGFAIAIGHPKQGTLQVLKQYANKLKNEYELVYISEMEEFLQKQAQKSHMKNKKQKQIDKSQIQTYHNSKSAI